MKRRPCPRRRQAALLFAVVASAIEPTHGHDAEGHGGRGRLRRRARKDDLAAARNGNRLQNVGNNGSPPEAFPLGRCQGDCDADADCRAGLVCLQRGPDEAVPGCVGSDASETDYCVGAGVSTSSFVGWTPLLPLPPVNSPPVPAPQIQAQPTPQLKVTNVFPLGRCQGECDTDSDCRAGLICLQREPNDPVPGCLGSDASRSDYCIRVGDLAPNNNNQLAVPPTPAAPSGAPPVAFKAFKTPFDGKAAFAGNMFDLNAKRDVALSHMGLHINGRDPINIKIHPERILRGATVKGAGYGRPTMIPGGFDPPIQVRKGEVRAFYVTSDRPTARLRSTHGTASAKVNGADIAIVRGVGKRYPMTGGTGLDRVWNGVLRYRTVDGVPLPAASGGGGVTFRRGDLAVDVPHLGIKVCTGMSVRVIARANQKVRLANGQLSSINFHSMPDGAAVIPLKDGRSVYVSNSEMKQGRGGVYGVYFDAAGNVVDYKMLLDGTTRNCAGGVTPWRTWVSCEEYGRGQCWQIDPEGKRQPKITVLGGSGGNYESVAVDNRIPHRPIFYVTEDSERGALRQYTPPILRVADGSPYVGWSTLHRKGGTTRYLAFLDGNRFAWTLNEERARNSQQQHFPNVEGINYHDRTLYFVSKKTTLLYVLDLDTSTYTTSTVKGGINIWNGGDYRGKPDQIVRNNDGKYLYLLEDGGMKVGVYAIHQPSGRRYAIFEAYDARYFHDETTGLAFSPDGKKMYASFQDCGCNNSESGLDLTCGCLMEFSRTDGRSFDGSTMSLKFHSK